MSQNPAVDDPAPSLYDQLGQEPAVREVVSRFYRRVLADPGLAATFEGVDTERLEDHQVAFFTMALGGPNTYSGRAMAAAHRGRDITDTQFDLVAGHLAAVLEELGVDQSAIATVMETVGPLRSDVVERPGA
jgi:truncated hemoglobin YjbI